MQATHHTHVWPAHSLNRVHHELRREFAHAAPDMIARAIDQACTVMKPEDGSNRLLALAHKELALLLALSRGARQPVML
ncbi:MAG: hypothetical protein IAE77_10535 [Prosthecobacter sp.]|jgi:hypothetical protein|uniref:hypothetical protein n=1 Tax=Prosthecobacter sp. TaxID=1965333 RepID=UPI0019FAED0D|nr:hypothetical protein [Prosthecobacter sp.]MBE2283881.1 hypothetical protein [Prosthecobacter sp.]